MLNKVSILVSVVVGLVLLAQFVADARRPQDPLPRPETARAEPEAPPPLDAETVKAALAEIVLPPPPALNRPEPQAAPEPKVTVTPMAPAEPEPVPVVEVTPLKAEIPAPAPEPVVTVKPLKPAEPAPEPEPVVAVKPLQVVEPAPEPEPAITIKPLKVETATAKPEPVPEPDPVVTVKPLKVAARPPVVDPRPQPTPRPTPQPRVESAPRPAADQPKTVQVSVRTNGPLATEGRALLRLLEHGSGPGIEIAWPRDLRGQETLHRVLAGCYGMRTVLMDGQGNLYHAEGARGVKWDLNLDRFSGFVRQPSGWLAAEERAAADSIRRYHGLRGASGPVRLFPRQVDAVLLGGLHEILGSRYRTARTIRASYRLDGGKLFVEDVRVDGTPVAGRIAFSAVGGRCRA